MPDLYPALVGLAAVVQRGRDGEIGERFKEDIEQKAIKMQVRVSP